MVEIILAILGSTALAALINKVGDYIITKRRRKYMNQDELEASIGALKEGVRYLLLIKIKEKGLKYLDDGEVNFEDRRLLHKMHKVYHDGLHGNGDLDDLMRDVDNLPLHNG